MLFFKITNNWNILIVFWVSALLPQAGFCYFKPKEKSAYKSHFTMTDPSQRSQKRSLQATERLTQTLFQLNRKDACVEIVQTFSKDKGNCSCQYVIQRGACVRLVSRPLETELMSLNVLWLVPFTAAVVIEHRDNKFIFSDELHFYLAVFCHYAETVVTLCHKVLIYESPNSKSSES